MLKTRRKFQISPLDGAQYANISSNLKQATRENNARYNSKMKNTPHAYKSNEKEFGPTKSKPLLFSFLLKPKQTHADYAIRAAKRTENALGNFMKLSSLPDESTY